MASRRPVLSQDTRAYFLIATARGGESGPHHYRIEDFGDGNGPQLTLWETEFLGPLPSPQEIALTKADDPGPPDTRPSSLQARISDLERRLNEAGIP